MSIKANMQRIFLSPHKRFKAALPKCTASAFLLMLCGRCSVLFFNNGHSLYSQIANISFSSISKRQRWNPPLQCGLQIAQRTYRKMINACTYYCFLILSHWWKLLPPHDFLSISELLPTAAASHETFSHRQQTDLRVGVKQPQKKAVGAFHYAKLCSLPSSLLLWPGNLPPPPSWRGSNPLNAPPGA